MDGNSRLSGVLGPCVGTTVERSPEKEKPRPTHPISRKTIYDTKHERRRASKLCAWFNYIKKVQCTHSFEKTNFERQLAFEQTSGVPIPLSV